MTLRTRLFLSGVAVVVPLTAGLLFLNSRLRINSMSDDLRRYVETEATTAALDRCEADPTGFVFRPGAGRRGLPPPDRRGLPPDGRGGPPADGRVGRGQDGGPPRGPRAGAEPPFELVVYRGDLSPIDPRAPAMDPDVRTALLSSDTVASTFPTPDGRGVLLALRLRSADSPCSVVVGRMRPRPGTTRDEYAFIALVLLSVLGAVWIAAGPVIARLRRLTVAVRDSAASHYAQPVAVNPSETGEIGDLARAFNAAGTSVRQHIGDLQARREALREFVANTTHDIALPLTVLQGHLADLDRTLASGSPEHERVRASIEEAHYLSSLLRNLGTAARLDDPAALIETRTIDLNAVVERVVSRHRALARAKSVELNYAVPEQPLMADADLTLLEQAIGNLVDNAVQYNRNGGHVAVVLDRQGRGFALTVTDDGPGVPEAELGSLTSRRFRGTEARSRRPDGQGIGLSIVAEAVDRLGFHLSFSRPDAGGLVAVITGESL